MYKSPIRNTTLFEQAIQSQPQATPGEGNDIIKEHCKELHAKYIRMGCDVYQHGVDPRCNTLWWGMEGAGCWDLGFEDHPADTNPIIRHNKINQKNPLINNMRH